MGKAAAKSVKTTTPVENDIDRSLAVIAARKQFVSSSINMGWQLALTILLPVLVGVKLDDHFDTSPSYTLVALFIAIGGAVLVVSRTVGQVNREQAKTKLPNTRSKSK